MKLQGPFLFKSCTTKLKTRALSCERGVTENSLWWGFIVDVDVSIGETMTNTTESCLWLTWEAPECVCSQSCMNFAQGEEGGVVPNSQTLMISSTFC